MRPALLPLLVLTACAARVPRAEPPLPLAPGSRWTYVDADGAEYRTRVEGVQRINGLECSILHGATAGISHYRFDSDDVAYVAVREGIPVLVALGRDDGALVARESVALVRPGSVRGRSWGGRLANGEVVYSLRVIAGGEEQVDVPAGRFRAHRVLEEWSSGGRTMVTVENWYADGVGIVRHVWTSRLPDEPERRLDVRLKEFAPAQEGR